ncbi:MAG: sugar transferase, partial [Clostridium perfringens]|nr:sugar transferase [Clostridium perfringens]
YWQANGRSDTTYEERVQMDMYYIDNRSLWLDIKIIFKTVISVIKKEGAV